MADVQQRAMRVGVGEGTKERRLGAWIWRLSRRPQQLSWGVPRRKVSTTSCTRSKTKQEDEFVARVSLCKP